MHFHLGKPALNFTSQQQRYNFFFPFSEGNVLGKVSQLLLRICMWNDVLSKLGMTLTSSESASLQLHSVRADEELDLGCWRLCKANEELVDAWIRAERVDEVTIQENGQLELIVEHHGVHTARSA